MSSHGLSPGDLEKICAVFRQFPALSEAILYGSRAKGTHRQTSDVDFALVGVDDPLEAEEIADALDELPLVYRFDVQALGSIQHAPLREHIARVGQSIYRRASVRMGGVAQR